MKRKLVALLSAVMVASTMVACGPKTEKASGDGPIEIRFWYAFKDKIEENNQQLVKEFNESQDKIVVTAEYQGDYDQLHSKTKASFAAGDAPEVSLVEIATMSTFAETKIIEDLTPFMEKDNVDVNDFHEGLMENSYLNDKIYGLPYLRSTPILYMNSTMLEENGLDKNGPKTWEEMEKYCETIAKGDVTGMTLPIDVWYFEGMLAQAGGSVLNEDNTKSNINSEETKKVLTRLKNMKDKGAIRIVAGADSGDKVKIDFKNQKTPMFFWSTANLTYNQQVADESNFELNTAFMPKDKEYGVPTGGCNIAMTSGLSKEKQDAAWEFINFMTSKEKTVTASKNTGYLPTRKSAVDSDEMKELYEQKPQFKVAVEQLEYAKGRPMVSSYPEVVKEVKQMMEKVLTQDADMNKELESLDKKINDILKK